MVKGINRQVIVVKSPDPKLFDQAIFLLREDTSGQEADTEQLIRQARQAADAYLTGHITRHKHAPLPRAIWGLLGACAASAVWAACLFLL